MKILSLIGICFFTMPSFAGEWLHLKVGKIQLQSYPGTALNNSENFVIQFSHSISSQEQNTLKNQGIEIHGYIPDDALLVHANASQIAEARITLSSIKAVSPYISEWKVDSELFQKKPGEESSKELFHIRTLSKGSDVEVKYLLEKIPGVKIINFSNRSIAIEAPTYQLQEISQLEGIEWIQKLPLFETFVYPITEVKKDDPAPYTGYESGTKLMGFDKAYELGIDGHGQTVAVADTGADTGDLGTLHPDLAQINRGYPMGPWNTSWADPMGHGTHVSGSIVGNGKSSDGKIRGGAFKANLIMEGMWNSVINNLIIEPDFNKLMGTPHNQGAKIHSNSWGSAANLGAYDSFAAKADEVMWNNPDLLVVFAAGNNGADLDKNGVVDLGSISSPGTAKNILTVGASENLLEKGGIQKRHCDLKEGQTKWGMEPLCSDTLSNNPNGIAAFSSRGPTKDGRIKPDIVAPGTNIVSTRSKHPNAQLLWGAYDANYVYAGGTSMATPLTAGAAAVTREFIVEKLGVVSPSAALIKALLLHTAQDLYPGQYGEGATQEISKVRPNFQEGYGRVNLENLVRLDTKTIVLDNTLGVGVSEESHTPIELLEGENLRATLVYTDAPAVVSVQKALVNDIDLVILGPTQTYQLADRVNNTEMLELKNLAAGQYTIVVKGINIPQGKNGKQPYALVVSRF